MRLIANKRILDFSNTKIMGILNVTPDSFFDGGVYHTTNKAIDRVANMIDNGASIIDIGGESTRPGAAQISELEESDRVLPIVREVVNRFDVCVSVNTSSALVIKESAMIGAHLINDVRSLRSCESMKAVSQSNLAVCLMHIKNDVDDTKFPPIYSDLILEISNYFNQQIDRCKLKGINRNRLLIDPGFGFGKNFQHNYQLLSNLKSFHHFNLPILIGVSRKSMINYNQYVSPKKKLIGSIACAVIAAMQGVHIVRVHDVKETMEALHVVQSMQKFNKSTEILYEV